MNRPSSPYRPTASNATISAVIARFTSSGKEKDLETGLSYFGARYYDADLTTGWLSVDPMADKYPSMSPYDYCASNPVKLVDPEGKEIYYKESNTYFVYKKNSEGKYGFYNCSTGDVYSGDNQQYVDDLTKALGQLKEGKYGNRLVSFFEGHQDHPLNIRKGEKNNQAGSQIMWNNTKRTLLPVGATINDPVQIEPTETFVSLGHEMAHSRDAYKFNDRFNSMSQMEQEQSAMLTENLIRREHGFRQRTFYKLKDGGCSVDYDSYPALVLPVLPIYYINVNQRNNTMNNFYYFDF
ncbi:MAG: M91 family zinc metallopeptidase [Paludibacteraceae bacterium]|nr:M91 family zinc metallopeptidase [Paludibacteraceae bacterium]